MTQSSRVTRPRTLRVRSDCINQVNSALERSRIPTVAQLAAEVELASSTVQNFLNGTAIYRDNFFRICDELNLNWQDIAHFTPEPRPDPNQEPPDSPIHSSNILLSDCSQDPSSAQQLRRALEAARQAVFMTEDWSECSDEELQPYDCFLLLVSSRSVDLGEIVIREVQRALQLRNARHDRQTAILLIHVGSPMSLPLNHALHSYLQSVLQLEWGSPTDTPTVVQQVLEWLEAEQLPVRGRASDESQALGELELLLQNLSKLNISRNWLLTYVGENQLHRLRDLVNDLRNEENRRVQSGYAYWGVAPTRMWTRACSDPSYHMLENIHRFPHYARQFAHLVDKDRYNFVSLGVGDGSKDSSIISDFFNREGETHPREDFLYISVDMSLEMLRVAIGRIPELPLHRRIAIQRDIETPDGMAEIAHIANILGQQQPILYGFIGNTIANVEDPENVLHNILQVMKADDLLLFEAQIVAASVFEEHQLQTTMQCIRQEYEGVSFRQFALSTLLQNSDLSIEPVERDNCYTVDVYLQPWRYGQVLQIDCSFENNSGRQLYITFSNEDTATLKLQEKIRLYRSRKFTQRILQNFVETSGFNVLGKSQYLSSKGIGFMVMLLKRQS